MDGVCEYIEGTNEEINIETRLITRINSKYVSHLIQGKVVDCGR